MGWGSAGSIFDSVADALVDAKANPQVITDTCVKLIRELEDGDWDTQDESLERYTNRIPDVYVNAVIKAFDMTDNAPSWCPEFKVVSARLYDRRIRVTCGDYAGHAGNHWTDEQEWS